MLRRITLTLTAGAAFPIAAPVGARDAIKVIGASQFAESHAFTKTVRNFEELDATAVLAAVDTVQ